MILEIIVSIILTCIIASAIIYVRYLEKKSWNNGISPSGKPWIRFDMDSSGARGYTTEDHKHTTWISWNFDKDYED